mgnify:CR=1 FL=1
MFLNISAVRVPYIVSMDRFQIQNWWHEVVRPVSVHPAPKSVAQLVGRARGPPARGPSEWTSSSKVGGVSSCGPALVGPGVAKQDLHLFENLNTVHVGKT